MKVNTEKSVGSHGNGNNSEATSGCRKRGKHDANLQKNGFLRFQIGLIVAMGLVYLAVELSTQTKIPELVNVDPIESETFEFHPVLKKKIKIEKPKEVRSKQKKKLVNPKFKIKEDDVDVEPTDVIDVELTDDEIVDVDDITEAVLDDPVEVIPFIALEDAPIFPGCEKVDKKDRYECFNKKMRKHIKRHFRYPDPAIEMRQQGRVDVMFRIGVDGNIQDIQMRGPAPILEKEAERIIDKLPKMIPGKQRDRAVIVPFSIPINFKLD